MAHSLTYLLTVIGACCLLRCRQRLRDLGGEGGVGMPLACESVGQGFGGIWLLSSLSFLYSRNAVKSANAGSCNSVKSANSSCGLVDGWVYSSGT